MTSLPSHIVSGRLRLNAAQQASIEATLEAYAAACAEAVAVGQRLDTTSNALIHRSCYQDLRTAFGLSANLTIRAIAQAARHLKEPSGTSEVQQTIDYDARTLSLGEGFRTVSLSTVTGRLSAVPFLLAASQQRPCVQSVRVLRAVLCRDQASTYRLDITLATKGSYTSVFPRSGTPSGRAYNPPV